MAEKKDNNDNLSEFYYSEGFSRLPEYNFNTIVGEAPIPIISTIQEGFSSISPNLFTGGSLEEK